MTSTHRNDGMPGRIQRGHRQECPSCEYTGKELIHHLETNHPEVCELYVRARRGMWLLEDHDGYSAGVKDRKTAGYGGDRKEGGKDKNVREIREGLRRKERQIAEMEAQLKERDERIQDLRETCDGLFEILETGVAVIPEGAETSRRGRRDTDEKAAKG